MHPVPIPSPGESTSFAAWSDRATPGRFARIADVGADRPDLLEEMFGPLAFDLTTLTGTAPLPHVSGMNTWAEAAQACRYVANSFDEIAQDASLARNRDPGAKATMKTTAPLAVKTMAENLIEAGEVRAFVTDKLDPQLLGLTERADLAIEMLTAVREKWRFARCQFCGGWCRIKRTRDVVFCSRRCTVAHERNPERAVIGKDTDHGQR